MCIGINVLDAAAQFRRHRYGAAAFAIGCAVFLLGLNIVLLKRYKRNAQRHALAMAALEAEHREIIERHAEIIRRTEESVISPEAIAKARTNLALVVKAVGATRQNGDTTRQNGDMYALKVGKNFFRLCHSTVYLCREDTGEPLEGTCIQGNGIPPDEMTATLLLLLKHDHKLYHKWAGDHDGHYYGA